MKIRTLRRGLAVVPVTAVATSLLLSSVSPASAATTGTWAIDANRHYAAKIQERPISGGDEFYIATIAFRSTPGVAGSTQAWFKGGLYEIDDIDQGEYHTIKDSMGRVEFPDVTTRSLNDALAGRAPELIGTISVVFESDSTPFRMINNAMKDLAGATRSEIARLVEPLSAASLANPDALKNQVRDAARRIKDEATPSTGEKIKLALGSAGDPDDLIGFKISLFAAGDDSLSGLLDGALRDALGGRGTGGILRTRDYQLEFAGDGARYDIDFRVEPVG